MSFAALSTELDTRIISYLDHSSRDAMSRVSRYYRQITEPYLYRHLGFTGIDHAAIKQLCLTVVSRRTLAEHIKTFILDLFVEPAPKDERKAENLSCELLKSLPNVQDTIRQVSGSSASATDQLKWLAAMLQPHTSFDGFLALILSVAKNIESIDLSLETPNPANHLTFENTFNAITLPCMPVLQTLGHSGTDKIEPKDLPKENTTLTGCSRRMSLAAAETTFTQPFSKLRHLRLVSADDSVIPVVPSLETLKVRNSGRISIQWPAKYQGFTKLHTIDFEQVDLPQGSLIEGLNAGYLTEVTRVRFVDTYYDPVSVEHLRFADAMVAHTPKLEYLEWIHFTAEEPGVFLTPPLPDLTRLVKVKTLRIDITLLVGSESVLHFENPKSLLPPNLHTLHLSSVSFPNLNHALQSFSADEKCRWIDAMRAIASAFPLRNLSMTVERPNRISRRTITILLDVADALSKLGTRFGIYRRPVFGENGSTRLVGLGFFSAEWEVGSD